MNKEELKPMLSTEDLIKHMKNKGITFDNITESEAANMLNKINYYFKVTSYRSNFAKDENGKYENLDFAYLTDLGSIDMQLRDYLLDLSLDIEHSIKVQLLNFISNDKNEDGYSIVQDFKKEYEKPYTKTIEYLNKNKYLHDMYLKHHEQLSIWVFLEVVTFGTLSMFIDFYSKRNPIRPVKKLHNYLKFSKNIRNACAHSNPILVNIFSDREFLRRPSPQVTLAASEIGISNDHLHDLKINDLVSLFYLHKSLQSRKMGEHRCRQGNRLIKRFHRHEEWYASNTKLNTFFTILNKMIDYLESE